MSYRDRIGQFIYTAPSGIRTALNFEELSRTGGKKAPVTEFPQQNTGAVQDLGQLTRRYPVQGYVSGTNYDRIADQFFESLNESGPGELDHPRFGTLRVLPVSVEQVERFVSGAGRAVFTIEFVQATDEQFEYPRSLGLGRERLISQGSVAGAAISGSLAGSEITDPGALAQLKEDTLNTLDTVTGVFDAVTGVTDGVRQRIKGTVQTITREIDDLVQAPQNLAESMLQLYRLPADVVTDVKEKVNGYRSIFETIRDQAIATTGRYGELFGLTNSANVQAVGVAAAESTASGDGETRADAIAAVDSTSGLTQDVATAVESIGVADYEATLATRQAMTEAIRYLLDTSLNLPAERLYVTPGDISPVQLAYELYGEDADIDARTNRIIRYNQLEGSSILLIPAGTEVRWYE